LLCKDQQTGQNEQSKAISGPIRDLPIRLRLFFRFVDTMLWYKSVSMMNYLKKCILLFEEMHSTVICD